MKRKLICLICIITLMLTLIGTNVLAGDNNSGTKDSELKYKIRLKANEQQLTILNSLNLENMTLGEIMIKVFPNEFEKLDKATKANLMKMKRGDSKKENEESEIGTTKLTYGSEIGMFGDAIRHRSYNDLYYVSKEMWVDSQLYDSLDPNETIYNYEIAAMEWTSFLEVEGYAYPPTGEYKVYANHWWMYNATVGGWTWLYLVSDTPSLYYYHPN